MIIHNRSFAKIISWCTIISFIATVVNGRMSVFDTSEFAEVIADGDTPLKRFRTEIQKYLPDTIYNDSLSNDMTSLQDIDPEMPLEDMLTRFIHNTWQFNRGITRYAVSLRGTNGVDAGGPKRSLFDLINTRKWYDDWKIMQEPEEKHGLKYVWFPNKDPEQPADFKAALRRSVSDDGRRIVSDTTGEHPWENPALMSQVNNLVDGSYESTFLGEKMYEFYGWVLGWTLTTYGLYENDKKQYQCIFQRAKPLPKAFFAKLLDPSYGHIFMYTSTELCGQKVTEEKRAQYIKDFYQIKGSMDVLAQEDCLNRFLLADDYVCEFKTTDAIQKDYKKFECAIAYWLTQYGVVESLFGAPGQRWAGVTNDFLQQYSINKEDWETWASKFTSARDEPEQVAELIRGFSADSKARRELLVDAMIHKTFHIDICSEMNHVRSGFQRGMRIAIPEWFVRTTEVDLPYRKLFSVNILYALMNGDPRTADDAWRDFIEKTSKQDGISPDKLTEFVNHLRDERYWTTARKKQFFGFVTGSTAPPTTMTVNWVPNDKLPQTHSCFNQIDLPLLTTIGDLKMKLEQAMDWTSTTDMLDEMPPWLQYTQPSYAGERRTALDQQAQRREDTGARTIHAIPYEDTLDCYCDHQLLGSTNCYTILAVAMLIPYEVSNWCSPA